MGFLSVITSAAKKVLPYAGNFLIGGIKGVMEGQLDGDLAGFDSTFPGRLGVMNPALLASLKNLDSPLDDNDRKGEECLVVTNDEITKRQAVQAMVEQARIEHLVLEMPVEGLRKSEITVTATYSFQFGPGESRPNANPVYVGNGDHVSFQLTPRKYNNFTQLTKHELLKFKTCRITSQLTSAYDSSTIVGYIPFVKDTSGINNGILGMLTKRVNLQPSEPLDFTIRYVSPALVEYVNENGRVSWNPKSMYLEPNKIVRADYIKSLYQGDERKTMFSYGTVIILKENTGEATISCKYKVEMVFDVWDYLDIGMDLEHAQQEWDDEHNFINEQTNESTSSTPSRRRRGVTTTPASSN